MRAVAHVGQMVHVGLGILLGHVAQLHAVAGVQIVIGAIDVVADLRRLEGIDALVQIAEEAGTATALDNALGQLALGGTLLAERALLNDALLLVQVAHAVGAGHGAELAADALRLVDLHGAVLQLMGGARRAHLHALGVLAVLALNGEEVHLHVREGAGTALNGMRTDAQRFNPEVAHVHAVDGLARHGAGKAARATVEVRDDRVIRH